MIPQSSKLTVSDLTVKFRSFTAVKDVNLSVPEGSILGIVGESGSGKSTVARSVAGLTPPTRGHVAINGEATRNQSFKRGRSPIQMIFQDSSRSLDPRFTVAQSIGEALPRMGQQAKHAHIEELLDSVSLAPELAARKPAFLSGGQRQRVAIARSLAANPAVLIADEITSSLDVSVQAVILNLLRTLHSVQELSMLFISHNIAVVKYMAERIAVMYRGEIVEEGPTEHIIHSPEHPYTQTLLDSVPRLDVVKE